MTFAEYQANAPIHVDAYLRAGIAAIDELLGKGYAAAHPELLAGYVVACAGDVHSNIVQDDIGGRLDDIGVALVAISQAIQLHE